MTENTPHGGYISNYRGTRFHTYNPMPAEWCCTQHLLDLSPEQDLSGTAVHEAGHLVADLVVGIHVVEVTLTPETARCPQRGPIYIVGGNTQIGCVAVHVDGYMTMLAAGEMAHRRWLADSGLETPERMWAVERGALDDTDKAISWLRDFCPPNWDDDRLRMRFWLYRPAAQTLLDEHWERVLKVAGALANRLHLSGDEAAGLAGLENPAEPEPQESRTP